MLWEHDVGGSNPSTQTFTVNGVMMPSKIKVLEDRIVKVRTILAECSVLMDDLDAALTAVEGIFPPAPVT